MFKYIGLMLIFIFSHYSKADEPIVTITYTINNICKDKITAQDAADCYIKILRVANRCSVSNHSFMYNCPYKATIVSENELVVFANMHYLSSYWMSHEHADFNTGEEKEVPITIYKKHSLKCNVGYVFVRESSYKSYCYKN